MGNNQFTIQYNGHPVAVTDLSNDTYMVQITYKPLHLNLQRNSDGLDRWIDLETNQETYLSKELGKLITAHINHYEPA